MEKKLSDTNVTLMGPKKCKNGPKISGFSYVCVNHSTTTEYGSWLQISYSNSKSYVYVAETPTYARGLDDAFLSVPASRKNISMIYTS